MDYSLLEKPKPYRKADDTNQKIPGAATLTWRTKPFATGLSPAARRFCFLLSFRIKWRWLGVRRRTLPDPVTLKRFAMDFRVLCIMLIRG
jgi:hypothetical protein